jgi:hypothetical protein
MVSISQQSSPRVILYSKRKKRDTYDDVLNRRTMTSHDDVLNSPDNEVIAMTSSSRQ